MSDALLAKHALPVNFESDYKAGKLDYTAVLWPFEALGNTPDCYIANSMLTKSLLAARTELFGAPDFFFQGHEYLTSCWLLRWREVPILMISAEGRGCSYEMLVDDLPERFGFNAPSFWREFADTLITALEETRSGSETLSQLEAGYKKATLKR